MVRLGLGLLALSTVAYEILLTRIFSVTLWYHFAFVAISIALFGMTLGALAVELRPALFHDPRASLRNATLLFAIAIPLSLVWHLLAVSTGQGVAPLALTYVAVATPFFFSGVGLCLALTRFPAETGSLYGADLLGAALGGLAIWLILESTDGPSAVLWVSALAAIAATAFAFASAAAGGRRRSAVLALVLVFAALTHSRLAAQGTPLLRVAYAKGRVEPKPLYEKWNLFSRISVYGDPRQATPPMGWGFSPLAWRAPRFTPQMELLIDGTAGTVITAYHGDTHDVDYLRYDITNLAHYLRPAGRVLVVGAGGGRDVLSALVFGQASVTGVEINNNILEAVNGRFGDFSGHLDRDPRVRFVNDEARSYLARSDERFDLLQISLIDTWAATAAGAFVLSENSLYTVEAFSLFLDRLAPRGLLSVSRWYFRDQPAEFMRLVSLATASLERRGVRDPRRHLAAVRRIFDRSDGRGPEGVGTLLVSRDALSEADVAEVRRVASELQFEDCLDPGQSLDPTLARIADGGDVSALLDSLPLDIAPPTDDRPYFFHMLRLRDIFGARAPDQGSMSFNLEAVRALGSLLVGVFALTLACIVAPLLLAAERPRLRAHGALFVFFIAIGLGYMLIEIAQVQRLVVFLGHPSYGLTVVLCTLLFASGLGSLASARVAARARMAFPALLAVLALAGAVTPKVAAACAGASTPLRIACAILLVFPAGFAMGMPFPLGMRAAHRAGAPAPWLWGLNGAASVLASVLAVVVAMTAGIAAAYWCGVACYLTAALAFVLAENVERVPA